MTRAPRPTLRTIAQMTGLAVPTVSRALSGAEDIKLATRERVRAAANEVGYVPNRAGVRLRTGRTHVIALVLSREGDMLNLTTQLINAAAGALRKTAYHLTISPYFPDEDIMRPVRYIVETGAADAIIINQVQPEDPRVRYLLDENFPFATHGRSIWADQHAWYDFDNVAFGDRAVRMLVDRGRGQLALLAPPLTQNYARDMVEGATAAARETGATLKIINGANSDDPTDLIEGRTRAVHAGPNPPDGWIFGSANACLSGVAGIEAAGGVVAQDVDIVSKEAGPFLARFRPGILSQREDAAAAGAFLARAALSRIETPDKAPMHCLETP